MRFETIINSIDAISVDLANNPTITDIQYDSRLIYDGNLFVALPGTHDNGEKYMDFIDEWI